jgi:hypothetical protein
MLRNIPNNCSQQTLVAQLREDFKGDIDFVYLPVDATRGHNVGYAFVNLRTTSAYKRFAEAWNDRSIPGFACSMKVCEVCPARFQGRAENLRRLRGNPVLADLLANPERLPVLLDSKGEVEPFPLTSNSRFARTASSTIDKQ